MVDRLISYPPEQSKLDTLKQWAEGKSLPERLSLPEDELGVLIPRRLFEVVQDSSTIDVVRYPHWIGRPNQEIMPRLSVFVVERDAFEDPVQTQETDETPWSKSLNFRRDDGISQGILSGEDKLLIALSADNRWNESGVLVHYLALASDIRNKGVGAEFNRQLGETLNLLGFQYSYGEVNEGSAGFFFKYGGYLVNQVDEVERSKLFPPLRGISRVRFFDAQLEKKCVKPEFLGRSV